MEKFSFKKLWLVLAGFFLILGGCTKTIPDTSTLYIPTAADVTAIATLPDLQQGRELYINNCGACHGLYAAERFTSSQWKNIMGSMAPKTRMSSTEVQLVTLYVTKGH